MIFCIILGYTWNICGYSSLGVVSWESKGLIDFLFILFCAVYGLSYTIYGGYKCKEVPDLVHP